MNSSLSSLSLFLRFHTPRSTLTQPGNANSDTHARTHAGSLRFVNERRGKLSRRGGYHYSTIMPDSTCVMCKAPRATKRCGKCRAVWYCSAHCQREHWTVHKVVCGWGDADKAAPAAADSGSNGDDDPNSLANFMKKRNAEKAQQAKELERLREEATDIVAALVGQPRDPALHLSLATKYLQLYRRDEAVEALGKAVDLLMSAASPAAAAESDVLRLGPSLLEAALVGRGELDLPKEEAVARRLVALAERPDGGGGGGAVSGSSGGRRRGARSRRTWRARGSTPTPSTNCAAPTPSWAPRATTRR